MPESNQLTAEQTGRNCSIDIFRYVCALLVLMIHTDLFYDVDTTLGFIFVQVLPRIAVPFFFTVAGYYYTQKLEQGEAPLLPYLKRLIIPYSIWSLLYLSIDYINCKRNGMLDGFALKCIKNYLIYGSSDHLWFFPALIFCVCFITLFFNLGCKRAIIPLSITLYIIGCLGMSYYELGIQVPVLSRLYMLPSFQSIRRIWLMGLPFFAGGYFINIYIYIRRKNARRLVGI